MFLLNFLTEQLSRDSQESNGLLSAIQTKLRANETIKDKVRDFMHGLVMTMENIEEISMIICSTSKFEIFRYSDQDKYLQRSLSKAPSSAYLIQWAKYFLANSQLTDDRKKTLLDNYINCLKNNREHLTGVLMAIDEILNAFDQFNDHNRFRLDFTNRIIDLCFQQSISFDFISSFLP